jgi:glycosyltransferase involved in cell wall biosynthesis
VSSAVAKGRIVMGLLFFPRGGSAQVTRYLGHALDEAGWSVSLVAGSLGRAGDETHAPTFFDGLDLHHLDYTAAVDAFAAGGDALTAPIPLHPSFEDREGAPDVVLAAVDPGLRGHLAGVWEAPFAAAGIDHADVAHLHHLTPQHDVVAARWPQLAVLAHLHGTELNHIEEVEARAALAAAVGFDLATMPEAVAGGKVDEAALSEPARHLLRTTRWPQWRHGAAWLAHLRRQAATADHLVVVAPPDRATAIELLHLPPERVTAVPNGVETHRFRPHALAPAERRAWFRRWLIEDPHGWDESSVPGSVAYREEDLDRLLGPDGETSVLLYVGRFTAAKRVPLLVEAFAEARARSRRPVSLVVWGGHPGEWEGEHPVTAARRVGAEGIFFAGWRGHHDLPLGLAASDALVMPSVHDSFAQTALEAMAVGLPVLATLSGGFPAMINLEPDRPTGWLIPPDDLPALADALVALAERPDEARARGAAALAHARTNLSWRGRVAGFEEAYAVARERHQARAAGA